MAAMLTWSVLSATPRATAALPARPNTGPNTLPAAGWSLHGGDGGGGGNTERRWGHMLVLYNYNNNVMSLVTES